MDDHHDIQFIISSGPEEAHRAVLGFSTAAAAVASGMRVVLFLVMNGARWAFQSGDHQIDVPGFQPVSELIRLIQAGGGTIEVCSNCFHQACSVEPDLAPNKTILPGITRGGLTTVAVRMAHTSTVTF
jgi:predicted peroxiredoxin